jgi:hypothetical protein
LKLDIPDAALSASTFWAVFLGAFLAAACGLAAGQVEAYFERRAKERNAALLFGEVFAMLQVLLKIAESVRGVGDPYGPVTMRMLRAARREIDVYDRNRETLYDLRDGDLRVRIHNVILRLTLPLEGVIDGAADIALAQAAAANDDLRPAQREEAQRALTQMLERRDGGFTFAMGMQAAIGPVMASLAKIARHDFEASAAAARAEGAALSVPRPPADRK